MSESRQHRQSMGSHEPMEFLLEEALMGQMAMVVESDVPLQVEAANNVALRHEIPSRAVLKGGLSTPS